MKTMIACVFGLALCARADAAPASAASVERLLVVTKTEAVLDAAQANVQSTMRQNMLRARGDRPMTPDEQKAMDTTIAKVSALMKDQLSWARMKPDYVRLYVETFDQDEIDGLLAFYQTKAGKAMVDKMPIVVQKSVALTQTQMQNLMPKMMAILQEQQPPK